LISELDFDIVYIKGKENHIADALSQRMHVVFAAAVSSGKSNLKDRVLEALDADEFYLQNREKMLEANVQERYKDYVL